MKERFTLSSAADAAVLVVGIAVAVQVGLQVLDRSGPVRSTGAISPAVTQSREVRIGDRLPTGPLGLSVADQTLLLFLRSTCVYCTASMPFYARVSEERQRSEASLRLVAVSSEPQPVLDAYLKQHGVAVDKAVSVRLQTWIAIGSKVHQR